jgi:hypothetical protein
MHFRLSGCFAAGHVFVVFIRTGQCPLVGIWCNSKMFMRCAALHRTTNLAQSNVAEVLLPFLNVWSCFLHYLFLFLCIYFLLIYSFY